jgi:hypothetical protein
LPAETQGDPDAGGEAEQPSGGNEPPPDEPPPDEPARDERPRDETAYSWEASEFVHHHKDTAWYVVLFCGAALLVAATVLLHSWLEMLVIITMTVAIVVYARKPPRTLRYELTEQGVQIDGRKFPFADFRSFGVVEDSEWHAVDLEPSKRFRPRMTMLFNSDELPEIVGHLELHLPREDRQPDLVEQVTRYLRF